MDPKNFWKLFLVLSPSGLYFQAVFLCIEWKSKLLSRPRPKATATNTTHTTLTPTSTNITKPIITQKQTLPRWRRNSSKALVRKKPVIRRAWRIRRRGSRPWSGTIRNNSELQKDQSILITNTIWKRLCVIWNVFLLVDQWYNLFLNFLSCSFGSVSDRNLIPKKKTTWSSQLNSFEVSVNYIYGNKASQLVIMFRNRLKFLLKKLSMSSHTSFRYYQLFHFYTFTRIKHAQTMFFTLKELH